VGRRHHWVAERDWQRRLAADHGARSAKLEALPLIRLEHDPCEIGRLRVHDRDDHGARLESGRRAAVHRRPQRERGHPYQGGGSGFGEHRESRA
jgi:hypothetical protein